ncbi:hypothetical protein SHELI_v1c00270 [Spiroplasma helicoides]|uniref:Uncharacterized protein n=1 Tax=Spiroplasma helicoides TaxID=216938 RepID=A0A1B3SJ75_9MOLU|nr:hypothetical protein [Spiroplasma helicoides]AOG59982.1 hypothetical protein SHELI_v1c00270 [Spiroplasma helicoides]
MNYYIRIDGKLYIVMDENTDEVVAEFDNEIDAHAFLQTLSGSFYSEQTMMDVYSDWGNSYEEGDWIYDDSYQYDNHYFWDGYENLDFGNRFSNAASYNSEIQHLYSQMAAMQAMYQQQLLAQQQAAFQYAYDQQRFANRDFASQYGQQQYTPNQYVSPNMGSEQQKQSVEEAIVNQKPFIKDEDISKLEEMAPIIQQPFNNWSNEYDKVKPALHPNDIDQIQNNKITDDVINRAKELENFKNSQKVNQNFSEKSSKNELDYSKTQKQIKSQTQANSGQNPIAAPIKSDASTQTQALPMPDVNKSFKHDDKSTDNLNNNATNFSPKPIEILTNRDAMKQVQPSQIQPINKQPIQDNKSTESSNKNVPSPGLKQVEAPIKGETSSQTQALPMPNLNKQPIQDNKSTESLNKNVPSPGLKQVEAPIKGEANPQTHALQLPGLHKEESQTSASEPDKNVSNNLEQFSDKKMLADNLNSAETQSSSELNNESQSGFFMDDFDFDEGAIIQLDDYIINNTDDDSLGEAASYTERKPLIDGNKKDPFEEYEINSKTFIIKENPIKKSTATNLKQSEILKAANDLPKNDESEIKNLSSDQNIYKNSLNNNQSSTTFSQNVPTIPSEPISQNVPTIPSEPNLEKQPIIAQSFENIEQTEEIVTSEFDNTLEIKNTISNTKVQTTSLDEAYLNFINEQESNIGNKVVQNKTITELYETSNVTLSNSNGRNDDVIDLGPIEEEDDIFSTPRMDFQQDEEEQGPLTKKDKKLLKKLKKRDEISRKKIEKRLK